MSEAWIPHDDCDVYQASGVEEMFFRQWRSVAAERGGGGGARGL